MLATPIIFVKEVVGLTERGSATVDLDNVVRHFDRIMSLLKRKCKGALLFEASSRGILCFSAWRSVV
jgi:hypothetical protein